MNRVAACIKLIQILSVRTDYIKTEELADLLETNPGNVREYIKEKGNGVNMYSYYDDTYRWYNKDKRGYLTYFSSTKPHDYKYRDD